MTPADLAWIGLCPEVEDDKSGLGCMNDYPRFRYSNNQVKKAGKALGGDLPWTPETKDEIIEVFRVAYNWRDSHAYPMRRMREQLKGKMRIAGGGGVTAARTKRMVSIRKKLRRTTNTLLQMQDLGGCRAIMPSIDGVQELVRIYQEQTIYPVIKPNDYIAAPKRGGYRTHHLICRFKARSEEEEPHDGRLIEVQIRSGLQHAWATAVEAVGLVRGEDMKAGEGDEGWRRLFELISSEFADAEGCPLVPGAPDKEARVAELTVLDRKLNAVNTLENLNQAFAYTKEHVTEGTKFFLIQFDNISKTVKVRGYSNLLAGSERYGAEERVDGSRTTVLVEADKIEGLLNAYPNYFLDVRLFTQNLAKAIAGQRLDLRLGARRDDEAETRPASAAPHRSPNLSWWFEHKERQRGR